MGVVFAGVGVRSESSVEHEAAAAATISSVRTRLPQVVHGFIGFNITRHRVKTLAAF
jgi:hypothetical protein